MQKTALRLPKDLHRMVSEAARVAGHSMNAEIISRLRASFKDAHSKDRYKPPLTDDQIWYIRKILREEFMRAGVVPAPGPLSMGDTDAVIDDSFDEDRFWDGWPEQDEIKVEIPPTKG